MALTEMINQLITSCTDVGEHAYFNFSVANDEAMWFGSIMFFSETRYKQVANGYGLVRTKKPYLAFQFKNEFESHSRSPRFSEFSW